MISLLSLLVALPPAAALDAWSLWSTLFPGFQVANDAASPSSIHSSSASAVDDLVAKYGNKVPGFSDEARKSLEQVILEIPGGEEQIDAALAHLVAKKTPSGFSKAKGLEVEGPKFEVFESGDFPKHKLRYNSPESLGVDSTKQYSGYLDYGEDLKDHLFYWFFESRNNPREDPVVLWLNGGPGCSSFMGLFFELGPSTIDDDLRPVFNEYSWNNNASIIFVDQPLNVGFSYSDDGTEPINSVAAERDVYALLELFFQRFPEYANVDFHIAGESYAGHYIPALGAEIWSHKERSFNLSSLLIGNGLTDPEIQYTSYADMACGRGGYPAVLEPSVCEAMEEDTVQCVGLIKKCYADQSDWACLPATVYCNNKLFGPYLESGYNFYDVRLDCGDYCYADEENAPNYLNQRDVQKALGVPEMTYDSCNSRVNYEFTNDGDWMRPYKLNITELLNNDVPVLVYAGDADYAVNWIGNERWTREVEWKHSSEFHAQPLKPWLLDDKEVGQVRTYKSLTFAKVYGGGHLVPHDQPESALDLFNRWISKTPYV